jgi:hypothetical protein
MKRPDTFLLLCECLDLSVDARQRIDKLQQKLRSGNVQWESLVEPANQYLLCPALYGALNLKKLLPSIPAELRQYLQTLYEANSERNRRLMALAQETVRHLNDVGVEPVLLKGTANLFSGLYPDAGMRFLSDIDILVPADKMTDCVGRLLTADYGLQYDPKSIDWKQSHHYPPLLKKSENIRVELHREILGEKYSRLLDAGSVMRDALSLTVEGMRVPSAHHRIIHNIAHTQVQDGNYVFGTIALRQLYDFVLMADAFDGRIDWPAAALQFKRNGYINAFSEYLLAASLFFGHPLSGPGRSSGHPLSGEIRVTMSSGHPLSDQGSSGHPLSGGIRATIGGQVALMWLCTQMNHSWAMRLGNIWRIAVFYRKRMQSLIEGRRMPKIWTRGFQLRNYRRIISELRRRW